MQFSTIAFASLARPGYEPLPCRNVRRCGRRRPASAFCSSNSSVRPILLSSNTFTSQQNDFVCAKANPTRKKLIQIKRRSLKLPYNIIVTENNGRFSLTADVPGVKRRDMSVEIDEDGRVLRIDGARDLAQNGRSCQVRFRKVLLLDRNVETDKITASLTDGVLVVTAPTAAAQQPETAHQTIEIYETSPPAAGEDGGTFHLSFEVPGVVASDVDVHTERHGRVIRLSGWRRVGTNKSSFRCRFEAAFVVESFNIHNISSVYMVDDVVTVMGQKKTFKRIKLFCDDCQDTPGGANGAKEAASNNKKDAELFPVGVDVNEAKKIETGGTVANGDDKCHQPPNSEVDETEWDFQAKETARNSKKDAGLFPVGVDINEAKKIETGGSVAKGTKETASNLKKDVELFPVGVDVNEAKKIETGGSVANGDEQSYQPSNSEDDETEWHFQAKDTARNIKGDAELFPMGVDVDKAKKIETGGSVANGDEQFHQASKSEDVETEWGFRVTQEELEDAGAINETEYKREKSLVEGNVTNETEENQSEGTHSADDEQPIDLHNTEGDTDWDLPCASDNADDSMVIAKATEINFSTEVKGMAEIEVNEEAIQFWETDEDDTDWEEIVSEGTDGLHK